MADSATLQSQSRHEVPASNSSVDFVSCDEEAQDEENMIPGRCENRASFGSSSTSPGRFEGQTTCGSTATSGGYGGQTTRGSSATSGVYEDQSIRGSPQEQLQNTEDKAEPQTSRDGAEVSRASPGADADADADSSADANRCSTDVAAPEAQPGIAQDDTKDEDAVAKVQIEGSDIKCRNASGANPDSSLASCSSNSSVNKDPRMRTISQGSADEAAGGGRSSDGEPKPSPEEEELMKQVPLLFEAMNEASEEINKLESSFTAAQHRYSQMASSFNKGYEELRYQYGSALDHARPYFDACEALERSQLHVQSVIRDFSEAASRHAHAKSELRTIEERLQYGAHRVSLDRAQQDGLSQATVRVLQSQQERDALEREYAKALKEYQAQQVDAEEQKHLVGEATIQRAMPGFRQMQQHRRAVVQQQNFIENIEENIVKAKAKYKGALKDLDTINQSIHRLRGDLQKAK